MQFAPNSQTAAARVGPARNLGWLVTFSGLGINLALGILYTWSMFKGAIEKEFGWQGSQLNDPYALCCLVFSFAMILAGRCQDKIGPRITATIGGLLVGAGFLLASTSNHYGVWMLGFGVLVGLGLGFGYSSATPPALKWFPPSKTGLIAGLVVAGFGLAPVYLAPVSQYLLGHYQLKNSMLILGIAFVVIVCGLAQLLVNPPAGFVAGAKPAPGGAAQAAASHATPGAILRQPTFWLLWVTYFIGAGAGLMVIGSVSGMAKKSMGNLAFVAVAVMAIGNAGGRITAGMLSDKIGRRQTLCLVLLIQAALMFIAIPVTAGKETTPVIIVLLASLIGFNYGVLFTAWGVGGLVLPRLQQTLTSQSGGSYQSSFITAGVLLLAGAALTFRIKPPQPVPGA